MTVAGARMWDGVERMDESFVSRPNLKKSSATQRPGSCL